MISRKQLRYCTLLVFISLLFAQSILCSENPSATKIRGKYSCIPNPCNTDPCLPGVVWAVIDDNETRFNLTLEGEWLWDCEETSWNGYIPEEGDTVTVEGKVSEHVDTQGRSYYNIEVDSLRRFVSTLPGTMWDIFVIRFPFCRNECGRANLSFHDEGGASIEWADPNIEGFSFHYTEQVSLGKSVIFTISAIHATSMSGWGMALIDRVITATMFSTTRPGDNFIIFGVPEECAKEGESFSFVYPEYPDHCCAGLTEWDSGFDTRISIGGECYETGLVSGSPVGTCINCGNGSCEEIEDICNCLEDCAGGINSDYATVDEFCNSEFWHNIIAPGCEELEEIGQLPICDLCPHIKEYSNSGCLENSYADKGEYPWCGEDEIKAEVAENRIHVTHLNATYNCCPDEIKVVLSVKANKLKVTEKESITTPCDCLCCYDVEAKIAGLIPGEYTVEVCWDDYETQGELCKEAAAVVLN